MCRRFVSSMSVLSLRHHTLPTQSRRPMPAQLLPPDFCTTASLELATCESHAPVAKCCPFCSMQTSGDGRAW